MIKVVVKLQIEGIHHWPDCMINEVGFLTFPHRHMFHVKLEKEVQGVDRDIEIIMLKRKILNDFREVINFGSKSCERIASDILVRYDCDKVEVLEDGELGAVVTK